MTIYLGLGSNQGDRKQHLSNAIDALVAAGFNLAEVSPLVESPALLPENAKSSWNIPYLNLVISGNADWRPEQGLNIAKQIEAKHGRDQAPRWSSRPLDIDLLVWHDQIIKSDHLTIPHPSISERDFVITPLMHLKPDLSIPGHNKTIFELSQGRKNIPLWMAILNLTPDSFSDGNSWDDQSALAKQIDKLIEQDVQIIDIGGESTRPGAATLDHDSEWNRLEPALKMIGERLQDKKIKPLISLDSRNPRIIQQALNYGIDIINDISGLDNPAMLTIAKHSDCQIVAMHSTVIPADPQILLPSDTPAIEQINHWIETKANQWLMQGIGLNRIIIDPGIGFGKNSIQAFDLLANIKQLRNHGMRVLIGHSRKSFMSGFTDRPANQRDLETLGISLKLCEQGIDIIRIHQPFIHQRAYRAWSHII